GVRPRADRRPERARAGRGRDVARPARRNARRRIWRLGRLLRPDEDDIDRAALLRQQHGRGPGDVAVRTGRPLDGCETPGRVDGPVTGRDRGRPSVGRRQGLRPEVERATRRRLRSAVASYVDGELRDGETVRAGRARLAGVALRTLRPNRATERRRHAAGLAYWLPFRNADV